VEALQTDFDFAMEELLKIRREEGEVHIAAGVPLQSEVKKLYSWAHQAGLTVPKEYIPSFERTVMSSTMSMAPLTMMEIPTIADISDQTSGPFQTIGPEDEK
ncbi:MAG: hypothetical protein Q8P68_03910, partial [Candidatus Peregrinibacteria bacterium]|nr:hypothetical protein [Candidatus Peregrinibacteria bacterium]